MAKAFYQGSARGLTVACVESEPSETEAQATQAATDEYGGKWVKPVSVKSEDWPTNPKMSMSGFKKLWLLVKGE